MKKIFMLLLAHLYLTAILIITTGYLLEGAAPAFFRLNSLFQVIVGLFLVMPVWIVLSALTFFIYTKLKEQINLSKHESNTADRILLAILLTISLLYWLFGEGFFSNTFALSSLFENVWLVLILFNLQMEEYNKWIENREKERRLQDWNDIGKKQDSNED